MRLQTDRKHDWLPLLGVWGYQVKDVSLNLLESCQCVQWLLMIFNPSRLIPWLWGLLSSVMTYGWGCVCVGKWVDMIGPLSLDPRITWAWITSCQGLMQAILFRLESWIGWKNVVRLKPHQEVTVLSRATIIRCSLIKKNTQLRPLLPRIYCNTSLARSA